MTALQLHARKRTQTGKQVAGLRQQGQVPAVIYGHHIEPQLVAIDYVQLNKIYGQAGESTLIDLVIDSQEPVKALIKDIQRDAESDKLIHVDFQQIRADEKLEVEVMLKFIGQSIAVKDFGGTLVTNLDRVEIECLPKDLLHEIEVNISSLKDFESVIRISDIKVPAGVTLKQEPSDVVALVQEPRSEKELADLEAKPEVAAVAPEKIGEKKPEETEAEAK